MVSRSGWPVLASDMKEDELSLQFRRPVRCPPPIRVAPALCPMAQFASLQGSRTVGLLVQFSSTLRSSDVGIMMRAFGGHVSAETDAAIVLVLWVAPVTWYNLEPYTQVQWRCRFISQALCGLPASVGRPFNVEPPSDSEFSRLAQLRLPPGACISSVCDPKLHEARSRLANTSLDVI